MKMLVLSRKIGEAIQIGDGITITVTRVQGDTVRLGITAPRDIPVHREDVIKAIRGPLPKPPG
jgi:carbon storage regulator